MVAPSAKKRQDVDVISVFSDSVVASWAPDGKILETLLPYVSDFLLD